jgi:sulfite reductase (NADPH) hemoprotein beta-component
VGPSFSAAEVPVVLEAVLDTYRRERQSTADGKAETFIATLRRVGMEPFKAAANGARFVEREIA